MIEVQIQDYIPHKNAIKFHSSTGKDRIIVSPIRAGKTWALIHDCIIESWNNPTKWPTLVVAPTNQQLKDIFFRPLFYKLLDYGLVNIKDWNKSENIIQLKNGNLIYGRSAESYERIRGLTIFETYVDEAALVPKECIDICRARMLTTQGRLNLATTPRGKNNWIYKDYFENGTLNDVDYFQFNIFDNPEMTIEAYEKLKEQYDFLTAEQELHGKFVDLYTSRIYREFDKNIHVKNLSEIPRYNLWACIDWNINIYACVIFAKINKDIYVIDEIYGSSNVIELSKTIVNRYGTDIYIVSDAANAQSHRELVRQSGLNKIYDTKSNPKRIDRYLRVNSYLKNANGNSHLFIDEKCSFLIKDLERLCFKKNSDEPDDNNNELGHISDALGYGLWIATDGVSQNELIINPGYHSYIEKINDMQNSSVQVF